MTYCPQVWDGFYINRHGDVYPCCVQKPRAVGNIIEHSLREILNGPLMIRARETSLNGTLPCYSDCTLLDKENLVRYDPISMLADYSLVKRLHVSFGEACNIKCEMCSHPIRHAKNPIFLDPEVVIRNVDIGPIRDFVIQGGEPLYISQCLDYMKYLEDNGKKYTILTNGLLIDESMAERLATNAKAVSISLNGATKETHERVNGGSDFGKVLSNITRLRRFREDLGTRLIIYGRMTITPDNVHEVPLFIATYTKLGFDRINFGFVRKTISKYLSAHPEPFNGLRREVASALSTVDLFSVDTLRLKQLGLFDGKTNVGSAYYNRGYDQELTSTNYQGWGD